MSAPPPAYSDVKSGPYPPPDGGSYPPPPNPAYPPPPQQYGQPQYPQQQYGQPGYGPPPPGGQPPPGYPVQAGYAPPPGPQGQTVVVTQPTVVTTIVQQFRDIPVNTKCPHCQAQVVTAIHFESGTITWVICLILCFIGLGLGCCFIPFCIDACKDCVHTCPNCRQQVARYNRM